MKLEEALSILRFYTGTVSDITGKSANELFQNKNIIQQLMFTLDEYARATKAIEDIYSFPLDTNTSWVDAPPLALRSESYRAINYLVNGRIFPGDIQTFANVYHNFPVAQTQGISTWFMPWGTQGDDRLYVFPINSTAHNSTTIAANCTATDTTIEVATTAGFFGKNGKITIGEEKIHYQYYDATHFYGCARGMEQTTAAAHTSSTAVKENNVWLFYSRLHTRLYTYDNVIPEAELEKILEVPEEHIETVLKYAAYVLLLKIDPMRATEYKIDWASFLEVSKQEIRKGRSRIRNGRNIRDQFWSETSTAYTPNMF